MAQSNGVKLVSANGHSHWADPTLRRVDAGFGLGVDCALGDRLMTHWLAPDGRRPGRYLFANVPHAWPSAVEAYAALEVYRAQEG